MKGHRRATVARARALPGTRALPGVGRARTLTVMGGVAALTLAACGGEGPTGTGEEGGEVEGQVDYPLTLENCDQELTFDAPPEDIVLLHSAPVDALAELDLLDRVTARAGAFPDEYYDEQTQAALDDVPSLADDVDADGHFEISAEAVIEQDPDLVMGEADGIAPGALEELGIPQLIVPAQCPGADESAEFADVFELVETYGQVFDVPDAAGSYADELRERVETITEDAEDEDRTAAALFPTVGTGSGFAYGSPSMTHPQLEAAGFTNVFEDVDDRVFEVTDEELVSRDPDVLVLLHVDGEPEPAEETIRSLSGADGMTAVSDDAIEVLLFNFSEPPNPLAVDGLERIAESFEDGQ